MHASLASKLSTTVVLAVVWAHFVSLVVVVIATEQFKSVPLCRNTSTLSGDWILHKKLPDTYSPWHSECLRNFSSDFPNIEEVTMEHAIRDHMEQYACTSQYHGRYRAATFQTNNCQLLEITDSTGILFGSRSRTSNDSVGEEDHDRINMVAAKPSSPPLITFLGDSLIGQLFVAAGCVGGGIGSISSENLFYIRSQFLRDGLPCQPQCLTNATFREEVRKTDWLNLPCFGCSSGKLPKVKFDWLQKIPHNTKYLVTGTGAWYNGAQYVFNSSAAYQETLLDLQPIFKELIDKKGVKIYWIGLPPMLPGGEMQKFFKYDWMLFHEKDAIAKAAFADFDVHFIDTAALLRKRKKKDEDISADGMHWCSPGKYSATSFLIQVLFHSMVVE